MRRFPLIVGLAVLVVGLTALVLLSPRDGAVAPPADEPPDAAAFPAVIAPEVNEGLDAGSEADASDVAETFEDMDAGFDALENADAGLRSPEEAVAASEVGLQEPLEMTDCIEDNEPPLMAAVDARDPARVRRLLDLGANPDVCFHYGEGSFGSPLETAVGNADEMIVRMLLEAGANPNLKPPNTVLSPLEDVQQNGPASLLEPMLEASVKAAQSR